MTTAPGDRRRLSPAAIVAVARRIADDEGIEALTLRRVAAGLGTGQASLYRHIADRRQLLTLLADELAAGYPQVADGDPGEANLRQWEAMRAYLAEHPWSARIIADGEHPLPSARPVTEHCAALLRAAGLGEEEAARAHRALWRLLLGHLLTGGTGTGEEDFAWAVRRLSSASGA